MSEQYVPTTEQVRGAWLDIAMQFGRGGADMHMAAFDRWLAAHDREVKAEAVREAAERIDLTMSYRYDDSEYRNAEAAAEVWLRLEADRIESQETP